MIVLLSAAFEPAGALTAETLAGLATGAARRLCEPLGSVETLRATRWEAYDPQRQQDRSKTHRSGGHP
jgi:phage portal protein BeeE